MVSPSGTANSGNQFFFIVYVTIFVLLVILVFVTKATQRLIASSVYFIPSGLSESYMLILTICAKISHGLVHIFASCAVTNC